MKMTPWSPGSKFLEVSKFVCEFQILELNLPSEYLGRDLGALKVAALIREDTAWTDIVLERNKCESRRTETID